MAFMRRILPLTGILVLALAAAAVAPADANHSWGKYHWARTSNPFTLRLGDNVNVTWAGHLATTSTYWSASGPFVWPSGASGNASNNPLRTTIVAGTAGSNCSAVLGTVQVCNANYGSNGWLGLAQIWITRGSHIAQGTSKMNDYYWDPAVGYAYANDAERLHVMCQEVGHTFGLNHQSETGASLNTCMDYYHNTSDADLLSTATNQHDYDQLAKIYGHLDRFTSVGSASSGGAPAVQVNGHAPDGTPNGASPALGRWYIEPLGGGEFLLTHVYWR